MGQAPLKLAQVTATFPPYWAGTGNVAYHNARLMHERGHEVTVFTAKAPRSHDLDHPFAVEHLPYVFRVGNAPLTPSLVQKLRGFDLIHLHYPYIFGAELTAAASAVFGIPLYITYHNDLHARSVRGLLFRLYTQLNQRLILRVGQRILATSEDYAHNSALAKTAPSKATFRVVPNGVDTEQFVPPPVADTILSQHGVEAGTPTVLFVGGLDAAHHFKGVDKLLAALSQLEGVHAILVGDGDLRARYEAQARSLAEGRVHFAGKVPLDTLIRLYGAATVTVPPSTTQGEAFGMVLIESLACGTPVIASDLPGVRTVVEDGVDGLLVPAGDTVALRAALRRLTSDADLARTMGQRGCAKVDARYAWSRIGETLEHLYGEALR